MLKEEKTLNNVYDNIRFERVADILFEKSGGERKDVTLDEFLSGPDSVQAAPKKSRSRKSSDKESTSAAEGDTVPKARKTAARKTAAKKEQE
jgi:hypothetical protein